MIRDPEVEVTCDAEGCDESITIYPDFAISNYRHAILEALEGKGWYVIDEKTYCKAHAVLEKDSK